MVEEVGIFNEAGIEKEAYRPKFFVPHKFKIKKPLSPAQKLKNRLRARRNRFKIKMYNKMYRRRHKNQLRKRNQLRRRKRRAF